MEKELIEPHPNKGGKLIALNLFIMIQPYKSPYWMYNNEVSGWLGHFFCENEVYHFAIMHSLNIDTMAEGNYIN